MKAWIYIHSDGNEYCVDSETKEDAHIKFQEMIDDYSKIKIVEYNKRVAKEERAEYQLELQNLDAKHQALVDMIYTLKQIRKELRDKTKEDYLEETYFQNDEVDSLQIVIDLLEDRLE